MRAGRGGGAHTANERGFPAMTGEDFPQLAAIMDELLFIYDFKPQEMLILHFLTRESFGQNRARVLVPHREYFAVTGVRVNEASEVLARLEDCHVVQHAPAPEAVTREWQQPRYYWPLTDWRQWRKIAPRVDREWARGLVAELRRVNTPGLDPHGNALLLDPRSGEELVPAQTRGLTAEIAATSREEALRARCTEEALKAGFTPPAGVPDAPNPREVVGNSDDLGSRKNRQPWQVVGNSDDLAHMGRAHAHETYTSKASPPKIHLSVLNVLDAEGEENGKDVENADEISSGEEAEIRIRAVVMRLDGTAAFALQLVAQEARRGKVQPQAWTEFIQFLPLWEKRCRAFPNLIVRAATAHKERSKPAKLPGALIYWKAGQILGGDLDAAVAARERGPQPEKTQC